MAIDQWFYAEAGQQKGPVPFSKIQSLAKAGTINEDTLIWTKSMSDWRAASTVEGVFDDSPPPESDSPPPANPYAPPSDQAEATVTGSNDYPLPPVRRSPYVLFLVPFLGAIALFITAVMVAALAFFEIFTDELSNYPESALEDPEVVEEIQIAALQRFEETLESDLAIEVSSYLLGSFAAGFVAWIFALMTLHKAWTILQPGQARTTPGKAVGFLFIPVFNLFWVFQAYYGWAEDWNRIRENHGSLTHLPRASGGLFLTTLIFWIVTVMISWIPFLNLFCMAVSVVLICIMVWQIYRVVNAVADSARPT